MRLHDYMSYIPHDLKVGIVIGHICRVLTNCMWECDAVVPFLHMLYEYLHLSYPLWVLHKACMRAHSKHPHMGLACLIRVIEHIMVHAP